MLQDEAATGVVVVDPDAASPSPAPSSSLPPTQLSPETLRALVLECGREEAEEEEKACSASTSTAAALKTRDRLRGQLGFCFEPMPWDQAVAAIADGGVEAMGRMGRTPEGVARYWRWRDEVCAKEYASTADFVRVEIVGFEVGVAGDGRKVAAAPPADASKVIWRENDFPYNFEAGIEHANVWALAPLSTRQLEALIEEKRPATDFETVWYVNPAALASIPDVWHAHVLSRRRRRPREEDSE